MSSCESVTGWLLDLKDGESIASQRIWERYVPQLVQMARDRLDGSPRRVADEEDVVAIAFASFCRGVAEGRFSKLDDRDDLWQVLVVLTERKAIDQIRREHAAKRGSGRVRGESVFDVVQTDDPAPVGLHRVVDAEPTPELAGELAEKLAQLLQLLADDVLQRMAIEKLEGYTNKEISRRLGMSLRSVERQLSLIRRIWRRSKAMTDVNRNEPTAMSLPNERQINTIRMRFGRA